MGLPFCLGTFSWSPGAAESTRHLSWLNICPLLLQALFRLSSSPQPPVPNPQLPAASLLPLIPSSLSPTPNGNVLLGTQPQPGLFCHEAISTTFSCFRLWFQLSLPLSFCWHTQIPSFWETLWRDVFFGLHRLISYMISVLPWKNVSTSFPTAW